MPPPISNFMKEIIEKKGLIICYIGAGKGKTTAAVGLAVRAAGAGMNVFILQFIKAYKDIDSRKEEGEWPLSNEIEFFNAIGSYHPLTPSYLKRGKIGKIETETIGSGFVGILGDRKQRDEHVRQALQGLERAREVMLSGDYQLLILDEIVSALELNLIEERDILELISLKPKDLHLVLTGHNKYPNILKVCDLVTEMKMIKHPYYKGILAQEGIDY